MRGHNSDYISIWFRQKSTQVSKVVKHFIPVAENARFEIGIRLPTCFSSKKHDRKYHDMSIETSELGKVGKLVK